MFIAARQRAESARSARAARKIRSLFCRTPTWNRATQIITDSAFGCAGQRCLAVSVAVTIGDAQKSFRDSISHAASNLRVGYGLDQGVQMGPVITPQSKSRVEELIGLGQKQGAKVLVDGRNSKIPDREFGNFVKPTILDGLPLDSVLVDTEIFGPVLSLVHAKDMDEALDMLGRSAFGNQASIFTSSGAAARRFRYEATAGNIGINIGVAAPMAYFPFTGWKDSFFGDMHAQGRDGSGILYGQKSGDRTVGERALAQILARNAGALLYYGVSALQRRGAVETSNLLAHWRYFIDFLHRRRPRKFHTVGKNIERCAIGQ